MSSQTNKNLKDFYGQEVIKNRLKALFLKFDRTGKFPSSIFIFGPLGCGKNTLVQIIAKKLGRSVRQILNIKNQTDFVKTLFDSKEELIVFDSLENFQKESLRLIYPLVKQKNVQFKTSDGKNINLDLTKKVIVGLSDRAGIVPKIIRENFEEIWHLENYKIYELRKIILTNAKKEKVFLEKDAALEIAHASRKNPKKALSILQKIVDEAKNEKRETIDFAFAQKILKKLTIDRIGLEQFDCNIIKTIIEKFSGGPVGIETYAAVLKETPWNIEEIYEPYLLEIGFLKRTPRGRLATRAAHEYFGYQYAAAKAVPKINKTFMSKNQKKLF